MRTERWHVGEPNKAGYYLAIRVSRSGRKFVSELWYNPYSGWWTTRGYLGDQSRGFIECDRKVIAWMPMPKPYKKEGDINHE